MRSYNFGPLAVDEVTESAKIVGRGASIKIKYVDAVDLIVYIAAGHSVNGDDHSELQDAYSDNITRVTLTGDGVHNLQINGLEPGTYIQLKEVSGAGTATMHFITGSEV